MLIAIATFSAQLACRPTTDGFRSGELRMMLDFAPLSLNPRQALDANSQGLGGLLFEGLTRLDSDLEPRAGLASRWKSEGARIWRFEIRDGLSDHEGQPINSDRVARCLESYRVGKPVSPHRAAFPNWIATRAEGREVILELSQPDPYLARNLSLLRYFRVAGSQVPCGEPSPGQALVGSGPYQLDASSSGELVLLPIATELRNGPDPAPRIRFLFVSDDNTRVLKLIRGEVDLTANTLSLSKTRWMRENYRDRFDYTERLSSRVNYLAFNLKNPILGRAEVRKALASAIPRDEIVRDKLFGYARVADSILAPMLSESRAFPTDYDPVSAERILDAAGFPRDAHGTRFSLRFKTTTVRGGYEMAEMIQQAFARIGVVVTLDIVEPATFLPAIKAGSFDLFTSRWVGVADGSIFFRMLRSGQPLNRVAYSNPKLDPLLDQGVREPDDSKRAKLWFEVQKILSDERPYTPLWYWTNGVMAKKGLRGIEEKELSLGGGFEYLMRVRLPKP